MTRRHGEEGVLLDCMEGTELSLRLYEVKAKLSSKHCLQSKKRFGVEGPARKKREHKLRPKSKKQSGSIV